jgi:xanthine/CO dehydrogenase XdhC/CoxF family maturation factor
MPLVRMATTLGWYVRVIDHRAAFATRDRFPEAAHVDVAAAGELPSSLRLDARTVAVTMNHNFRADSAWLRSLAALPLPYVGVLGARSRTEKLLRDAALDTHGAPGAAGLQHVFAPAGLDIGSEGAEQIALAIIAEIQTVLTGHGGTSLRDRPGRVSQPAAPQIASASSGAR